MNTAAADYASRQLTPSRQPGHGQATDTATETATAHLVLVMGGLIGVRVEKTVANEAAQVLLMEDDLSQLKLLWELAVAVGAGRRFQRASPSTPAKRDG